MNVRKKLSREIRAAGLAATGAPGPLVDEADVAGLPPTAQRYLRFMRAVGRPRDTTFRAHVRGRFRPGGGKGWLDCDAWQFNSQPDLARFFYMQLRMAGVPVIGRDTYAAGAGRMLVRPLDLFTVQDGRGPEYDLGELVTWLNDAVLLAPSMLLGASATWSAVDDRSFDVSLTDGGTTVSARVLVDERGAPTDFATTDRYCEDPFDPKRPLVQARWTTPLGPYAEVDGRMLPTSGRAVWHLPSGEFPYAELAFRPGDVVFNVAPGSCLG